MATNTNAQYQGAIKSDSKDIKNDAYRLKNDVTSYSRQAGRDAVDVSKQASRDARDAVRNGTYTAYDTSVGMLNQVVSPQTREGFYNGVKGFCVEQPYIASFLASQTVFSAIPVSIFAAFSLGVITFTAVVAFGFAAFWIGTAVLVLTPVLFITSSLALGAWVWAVGTFLISRWIYNLVPVSVRGTTEIAMPNHKKFVINKGQGFGDVKVEVDQGRVTGAGRNGIDDGMSAAM